MSKHTRTKLVSQSTKAVDQILGSEEEIPSLNELDMEIECPRCNEVMELHSSFDKLVYFCDNYSFVLTGI